MASAWLAKRQVHLQCVCQCFIRDPGPHAHSTGVSQAVACHPLWAVLEPLSSSRQLPAILRDLTGHQPMICSWVRKGRKGEIPLYPHQGLLVLWGKGLWWRVRESLCVDEIHALQGSVPPSSPRGQFINSASILAGMAHLLPWIWTEADVGVKMTRIL